MSERHGKALVAMSGGVDSSVAAALLLREGYEVVGCFMRLGSPGETLDALVPADEAACDPEKARLGHRGCCSVSDAADARLVAAELGIPLYVCNFKKEFGRIIDYFVGEYAQGRTPNPCVRCNDWLKFGRLHEYAAQIDADFVASGHYARIGRDGDAPALMRGLDARKDQSYVLFGMRRDRLGRTLLPVGEFEKPRVREMAQEFGLPVFDKPDSQEICFVPDDDYAGLVERRDAAAARMGDIVDVEGNRLGEHAGQHRFTVGQRRGLDLALGYPVYVVGRDAATNVVTVGPREALLAGELTAAETNWLIGEDELASLRGWRPALAQFRAHGEPAPATIRASPGEDRLEVRFNEPQEAVAPGQAVVCYDGERVLGGGWITRVEPAA